MMNKYKSFKSRKTSIFWDHCHEQKLFDLWDDSYELIKASKKISPIYATMAEKLIDSGLQVEWKEVRTKVDNLTRKYRMELLAQRKTRKPSVWRHFKRVHGIFSKKRGTVIKLENSSVDSMLEEPILSHEGDATWNDDWNSDLEATTSTPGFSGFHNNAAQDTPSATGDQMANLEMTPYEQAMIQIYKERTAQMKRTGEARIKILQQMAKDNEQYYAKMLDLLSNNLPLFNIKRELDK